MIRRAPRAEATGWQADSRLSWDARGLLAFILAQPDNYRVNRDTLANAGPDGLSVIRTALKELTNAGYISRERVREANGTFTTDTVVFEQPRPAATCGNRTPVVDYPPPVNQPVEASIGLSKDLTLGVRENRTRERKPRPPDPLWDALCSVLRCQPATKTERGKWNAACGQLRAAGATDSQVRARAGTWKLKFPGATLTPMALAAHWGALAPPVTPQVTRLITEEEPPPDFVSNTANLRAIREQMRL